jgi:steroid 5-alpha reductase family enzyme
MSNPFTLLAIGVASAAAAMALVWARDRNAREPAIADAACMAIVAALAVLYATKSDTGALGRRVAIASMIASWGARRAMHVFYERAARGSEIPPGEGVSTRRALITYELRAGLAVVGSLPALVAVLNPDPDFAMIEYVGAAVWFVGFAGESTVDRRRLARQRVFPYAGPIFLVIAWVGLTLFASASI